MNPSAWQSGRRMVPRWRSLSSTLRSLELGVPQKQANSCLVSSVSEELEFYRERWISDPGLQSASELIDNAIIEGHEHEAINAARRVVFIDKTAAPLVRQQAADLLARAGLSHGLPAELVRKPRIDIAYLRGLTRLHPHDPLVWVELSLHQTIRGALKLASRSMSVAMQLSPDNRHVLRSASRLFLHLNDPEKAHDILLRSSATRLDPWLIAAEIALAGVAQRHPKYFRQGLLLVDDSGFMPRQLTELAGAIGTVELLSGNRKKSKRHFVNSMRDPTGSALAQGEWATPGLGSEIVPSNKLASQFENSEARAFHLYRCKRYQEVSKVCDGWAEQDPFSVRPFEFGATTANLIGSYGEAEVFAKRGLELRPRSSSRLVNSRAFALGSLGRTAEAGKCLAQLSSGQIDNDTRLVATANYGLIAFREGQTDIGRELYRRAIDGFAKTGDLAMSCQARIYLAREAILSKQDDAKTLLSEAKRVAEKLPSVELKLIVDQVVLLNNEPNSDRSEVPKEPRVIDKSRIRWVTPGLPEKFRIPSKP